MAHNAHSGIRGESLFGLGTRYDSIDLVNQYLGNRLVEGQFPGRASILTSTHFTIVDRNQSCVRMSGGQRKLADSGAIAGGAWPRRASEARERDGGR